MLLIAPEDSSVLDLLSHLQCPVRKTRLVRPFFYEKTNKKRKKIVFCEHDAIIKKTILQSGTVDLLAAEILSDIALLECALDILFYEKKHRALQSQLRDRPQEFLLFPRVNVGDREEKIFEKEYDCPVHYESFFQLLEAGATETALLLCSGKTYFVDADHKDDWQDLKDCPMTRKPISWRMPHPFLLSALQLLKKRRAYLQKHQEADHPLEALSMVFWTSDRRLAAKQQLQAMEAALSRQRLAPNRRWQSFMLIGVIGALFLTVLFKEWILTRNAGPDLLAVGRDGRTNSPNHYQQIVQAIGPAVKPKPEEVRTPNPVKFDGLALEKMRDNLISQRLITQQDYYQAYDVFGQHLRRLSNVEVLSADLFANNEISPKCRQLLLRLAISTGALKVLKSYLLLFPFTDFEPAKWYAYWPHKPIVLETILGFAYSFWRSNPSDMNAKSIWKHVFNRIKHREANGFVAFHLPTTFLEHLATARDFATLGRVIRSMATREYTGSVYRLEHVYQAVVAYAASGTRSLARLAEKIYKVGERLGGNEFTRRVAAADAEALLMRPPYQRQMPR